MVWLMGSFYTDRQWIEREKIVRTQKLLLFLAFCSYVSPIIYNTEHIVHVPVACAQLTL